MLEAVTYQVLVCQRLKNKPWTFIKLIIEDKNDLRTFTAGLRRAEPNAYVVS